MVLNVFTIFFILTASIAAQECGQAPSVDRYKQILSPSENGNQNENRILAGDEADEGQWPFLTAVVSGVSFCSGSVVHKNWILTAAHCCSLDRPPNATQVIVGSIDLFSGVQSNYTKGQSYTVSETFIFPHFQYVQMSSDICLLKIGEDLKFDQNVQPICLQRDVQLEENELLLAVGFGSEFEYLKVPFENKTWIDAKIPEVVLNVTGTLKEQVVQTRKDCFVGTDTQAEMTKKTELKICIGGQNSGPLPGDSGGPLLALRGDRWVEVGVTSYGQLFTVSDISRIDIGASVMYTRVSAFCDWMEAVSNKDVQCH